MKRVAKRISDTSPKSFGMYEKALAAAAAGHDLIHFELGRPCADTPSHIKEATVDALRAGHVHYSDLFGLPALRQAIVEKLKAKNGIDASPDQIMIVNGLSQAAFVTFMALLDSGDEVIMLAPYYPQHIGKIELTGAKVVVAALKASDNFAIDVSLIEPLITARTRMIVVVNPVNPTGRVYTLDELRPVAELASKHDLMVLADEIYDDIVFDGIAHGSIGSLPGMAERTVSAYAFTKSFAMDGWRIGYLAAPKWLMPAIMKVTANDVTHVNTFIQYGALAALTGPRSALDELVAEDERKRNITVQRLNQMPGVSCVMPGGSIYAFADVSAVGIPSQRLAEMILDQVHVVVEAGSFYGTSGEGHLRICFGSESAKRLEEGLDRLAKFFNGL